MLWKKSQSVPLEGRVRAAIIIGGSWQSAARRLNEIVYVARQNDDTVQKSIDFNGILLWDVAEEIEASGVNGNQPHVFIISPSEAMQTGYIIKQLAGMGPKARLVSKALEDRESDAAWGAGQIPGISWAELQLEREQAEEVVENMVTFLRALAGGTITRLELHVMFGTGGGAGRGAFRDLTQIFRNEFAKQAPTAALAIRYYPVDGASYQGCGSYVELNGATGASQIVADLIRDPFKTTQENTRCYCLTLPHDGTDRNRRNMHVCETTAMMFSPEFHHHCESTGSNRSLTEGAVGKADLIRFTHFGRIGPNVLVSTPAAVYEEMLRNLLNAEATALATPVKNLDPLASLTDSPQRSVAAVMSDIKNTKGADERFLTELPGVFAASATVYAELTNGQRIQAMEICERLLETAKDLYLFLSDAPMLDAMLSVQINQLTVKERKLDSKAKKLAGKVQNHFNHIYGTWLDKVKSLPGTWQLIGSSRSKKERVLQNIAEQTRAANEKLALVRAQLTTLKELQMRLEHRQQNVISHIRQVATVLNKVSSRAQKIDGVYVQPIENRLIDLLWASGLPDTQDIEVILLSCIEAVSIETLARYIFGYTDRMTPDAMTLVNLIRRKVPEDIGTNWGNQDRSEAKPEICLFVPLRKAERLELQQAYRRIDGRVKIVQVGCGAGVFVGGAQRLKVEDFDDIVTPFYRELMTTKAETPEDFVRACVPGAPLWFDPAKETGKKAKK